MVLISVDYDASVNSSAMHYFVLSKSDTPTEGPLSPSTPPGFKSGLAAAPVTQAMNHDFTLDPLKTNLKLHIGGGGTGGGGFATGGCFYVSTVYFMANYKPTGILLVDTDPLYRDFMYGHF